MNEAFCSAPWSSLYLDPNGIIKPCCVSYQVLGLAGEGMTLSEAYSSPELTDIRKKMLAGEKLKSCRMCFGKEKLGINSRRQTYAPIELEPGVSLTPEGDPRHVYLLDISFSNVCNLRCRFCGPFRSSKWIEDSKKLPDDPMWRGHKSQTWKIFNVAAEQMLEQVSKFPNAKIFDVNGGEPFMSAEHLKFLQLLVDSGRAADTKLIYTTNGTVNPQNYLPLLAQFQDVKVAISSEGIGDVYRYSRGFAGAEQQLENTIKLFASLPNVRLAIHYTIGSLNIFGIKDFFEWFKNLQSQVKIGMTLGVVVSPSELRIDNLPLWFREMALAQVPEGDTQILQKIRRAIMEEKASPFEAGVDRLQSFWKYVRTLDELQKTSLVEMQPLYKLIDGSDEKHSHLGIHT